MDNEFSILGNRGKLINDRFQNFKTYGIPHAQLIIADPPYNLGKNAYASNPALEQLISIFTDPNDVVIDPTAGSGSSLRAAVNIGRKAYGFEIKKDFYKKAKDWVLSSLDAQLNLQ